MSQALDIQWNGSGGLGGDPESWENVDNWDPVNVGMFIVHRVPGDGDTATLDAFTPPFREDVRLFANTAPINGLTVRNGYDLYTNGFLLEVDDGGSANTLVTESASIKVEPRAGGLGFRTDALLVNGSQSSVRVDGGEALVEGVVTMFTGGQVNGADGGIFRFGDDVNMVDGVLRMIDRAVAEFAPNTTLTAQNGSIVDLNHQVNINDGITFDFQSSARLEPQSLYVGNDGNGAGSVGTLLLEGSARVEVSSGGITVGHATVGTGLVDLQNAVASIVGSSAILATGTVQIDDSQFAVDDLLVDGGTITAINGDEPIFLRADHTLTARNNAKITIDGDQSIRAGGLWQLQSGADVSVTGEMTVGKLPGNPGALTLTGTGTTFDLGGDLRIGDEQLEGSVMLAAGATADIGGNVEVGYDGTGSLRIESGATLAGNRGRVATFPGATGTATVTGAGALWSNSQSLSVGSAGAGQLTIENGGRVTAPLVNIGADVGSNGMLAVTGTGSTLHVTGNMQVGEGQLGLGGAATVRIESGGAVEVGNVISVHNNDTLQLDGGTLTIKTLDLQGGQFDWDSGTLHAEMVLDDVVNQGGTLAPGKSTPGDEIGLTTIDADYTQQNTAALALEIAGTAPITDYDQVSITGNALLAGDIEFSLLDGFLPQPSDTFTVLSALGGIAGTFDNVLTGERLGTLDGIGSFLVHYGPGSAFDDDQIVLSDFQAASADTEPDGDVDGADFLAIQRTNPALISLWEAQFGSGVPLAASHVVPEPTSLVLLACSVFLLGVQRKRQRRARITMGRITSKGGLRAASVILAAVAYCVLTTNHCAAAPITLPFEVFPGEAYRLTFRTLDRDFRTSQDIEVYNDAVTTAANTQPELAALGVEWKAIVSVSGSIPLNWPRINARENTSTDPSTALGESIYLVDGTSRIASNNADLWDGEIDHPIDVVETGQKLSMGLDGLVATGTASDGSEETPLGGSTATLGSYYSTTNWVNGFGSGQMHSIALPLYALSSPLKAPGPAFGALLNPGPHGKITRIAIKGDPAADGNGTINGLGVSPVLNDQSQVLYVGLYVNTAGGPDDELAAVRYDDGVHTQVLRSGSTAPDGNGKLADFIAPKLNNNGSSAYYALYADSTGGIADDQGIIVVDNANTYNLIRESDPAPSGNGVYNQFNNNAMPPLAFNDLDQVALSNDLLNTVGGMTDDRTVVRGSPGVLMELARRGDPTPTGIGDYGRFAPPVINDGGSVAFHVTSISGLSPGSDARQAIIRQFDTLAVEIARSGQPAPDGNGTINPFGLDSDLAINEAGEVAFAASFKNTTGGSADAFAMLRGDGIAQHIVARAGDAAPDGNGTIEANFESFRPPKISEFGEVAFRTKYSGTSNLPFDDNGIVKAYANGNGRELAEVAREGWSLPGGVGEFFNLGDVLDINRAGVVAFTSSMLNVPSPPSNPLGIFLGDGIDVVEVVRTGATVDGDEVFEVVSSGLGITEGSLNRHGQVAFNAQVRPGGSPTTISTAVYLFTPDLFWRGGTIGTWEEKRTQLGDVNNFAMKNWTLSLTPAGMHDVIVDRSRATAFGTATPFVEITGPSSDVTVRSLELREATRLNLIGTQTFTALDGFLLNGGALAGSGEVVGNVEITAGGALETVGMTVHSEVINNGQTIVDNATAIPSFGTFNGDFHNSGSLRVGVNQTAEFVGDYHGSGTIDNDGTIIFHGLGPGNSPAKIEVLGTGTIALASGGTTTFELGGTLRGSTHGDPLAEYDSIRLVDGGTLDLGGTLVVELISPDGIAPIFEPALGDTFTLFEATQLQDAFDLPLLLPDLGANLGWSVLQTASAFTLSVIDAPDLAADLDNDNDVDGADFLAIQRTNPALISLWETEFGSGLGTASSSQFADSGSMAVPEPGGLLWFCALILAMPGGRDRRRASAP